MPRKKEVVSGTFVKYDAVVLGSGPAGEGAAMKLAKSGKRVAIVEMREQLVVTVPMSVRFQVKHCVKQYPVLSVINVIHCFKKLGTGSSSL